MTELPETTAVGSDLRNADSPVNTSGKGPATFIRVTGFKELLRPVGDVKTDVWVGAVSGKVLFRPGIILPSSEWRPTTLATFAVTLPTVTGQFHQPAISSEPAALLLDDTAVLARVNANQVGGLPAGSWTWAPIFGLTLSNIVGTITPGASVAASRHGCYRKALRLGFAH